MITTTTFFTADGSGNNIYFSKSGIGTVTIDNVRLQKISTEESDPRPRVKEFLSGNLDDSQEIVFRADSQTIQLIENEFETLAVPLAVVTKVQRGSLIKCFVALGDDEFYELEGNAVKGVSLVKVHPRDRGSEPQPKPVRDIRISWRDSSKQLCRLSQGGIIFLPTQLNHTE